MFLTIKGGELFAGLSVSNDDSPFRQQVAVERMQGLTEFQHDVVGQVNK